MTVTASADSTYYTGQGNILIAPRLSNGGALTSGYSDIGDIGGFTLNQNQTMIKVHENNSGLMRVAGYYPGGLETSIKLQVRDFSRDNLAKLVWGTEIAASSGGTVTGEPTMAYNGKTTVLANMGVSAVTLTAGATPLVLGTDYTLDGSFGTYTILPGSTVVPAGAGVAVTAAYTYDPNNGGVAAYTGGLKEYSFFIKAKNIANPFTSTAGSQYAGVGYKILRVALNLSKTLDMIGTKATEFEIDGEILPDPSIPYVPGGTASDMMTILKA